MLFECINAPIKVDGKEVIKDFRMNIQDMNKLRAKFTWVADGKNLPFDIVIYNFSTPVVEGMNATMTINGEEYAHHIPFYVKISYSLFGKKMMLHGSINKKSVSYELRSPADIVRIVPEIAKCIK